MIDIRKIRTLRDDVVLCMRPERDVEKSLIYYEEDVDTKTNQYFEVIGVGPETRIVKPGDVVMCSWMRITPPQDGDLDGKTRKYGVTSEKEILCIVGE